MSEHVKTESDKSLAKINHSTARVQVSGPSGMTLSFPLLHKRATDLMLFAAQCAEEIESKQKQWAYEI